MQKLELYTGTKTYMYPDGTVANPARMESDFPAVAVFPHAIQTDSAGQVCFAVQNLAALRDMHDIDAALTDAEALAAIEAAINAPPPEPGVSAEERIAAALEYQVVASMPDDAA